MIQTLIRDMQYHTAIHLCISKTCPKGVPRFEVVSQIIMVLNLDWYFAIVSTTSTERWKAIMKWNELNGQISEIKTHAKRCLLQRSVAKILIPTARLGNSGWTAEFRAKRFMCPWKPDTTHHAHRLHLACEVTSATDRRPYPSGANTDSSTRLELSSNRTNRLGDPALSPTELLGAGILC